MVCLRDFLSVFRTLYPFTLCLFPLVSCLHSCWGEFLLVLPSVGAGEGLKRKMTAQDILFKHSRSTNCHPHYLSDGLLFMWSSSSATCGPNQITYITKV